MESATTTDGTPQETDAIADMFDESSDMSEVFNDGQVHLSYWYDEEDEAPLIEAAQRLTRKVADSLGLREGDRVLDVGCGLGAPALQLATEYGVRVTGVNISPRQVAEARARARKAGLADQVDFHLGDYGSLDLPDDSFDAVVAMESLVYVADLGHTLGSLRRVMRPGARLSLAEPTREGLGVVAAAGFAADFGAKWLLSVEDWLGPLREAGFEPMEYLQCGPRVFGMGPKYLHAVDVRREELAARFGGAAVDELRGTLETFFAPGASRIGYAIITARKPRD
ncbi:putative methyltransferase type 11 [Streptomyces sp. Tu6071]|uniref:Methyltransferase domain-containing protein n=1 Tax=Streptomyces evansiae TaxID=3075535 RepID=A0ABD5E1X4_9ACTN|nr:MULTISPECIES: class I SAM-dependent methyltransferase [unclassified Streptomyces]ASY34720.1 SAM-dependent methyltransferase [Streptomyces sp. CLI2509]EGJ77088.1 putative methyltransferase type 11 [Streptomyces sp. Tu6071]MDT0414300.1 methyltransferase domain-containing protein [Streptomyces sp. DSM 41982]MYX23936.1 methyltransferase domain-containing protein [Streptomyces sp. SID8380]SCD46394.1 27-O-demethylrifamycin SV methyltransferase [Streptomyces sp. SolWspMP-sol7th]